MADKGRLSRKDIKQPDEFITQSAHAVGWARQHQQIVVAASILGILLLLGVGLTAAYRAAQQRDANADLARAMAKLQTSEYAAAANELTEVSGRWSGTEIGPLAAVLAISSAVRAGEVDKALAALTAIQAQADALPPYLRQQVFLAWGAALESKQQWADAAGRYQEAAAIAGPYSGDALVAEAGARAQAGEGDKARELYRQAYEQYPELPARDLLKAKIGS